MNSPDISNLPNCIEDARQSWLDGDSGPDDPTDYHALRGRLEASRHKLPPLYRESVFDPFTNLLDEIGLSGFTSILVQDTDREGIARLVLDISHAIVQNGEEYQSRATDAFQEVVSDLYNCFLSAGQRTGVEPPDLGVIPPLVKWGEPLNGPYTWTVAATLNLGVQAAIVSLPPANARLGILAWVALSHETAGHDILHADTGLHSDLAQAVQEALEQAGIGHGLPEYWSARIDETASDVLGILHMGPAAGIGQIGYFRGLRAATTGSPKLQNVGLSSGDHPADILRGYLAASTVRILNFEGAADWANILDEETTKDVTSIRINVEVNSSREIIPGSGTPLTIEEAKRSADVVANTLVNQKVESLERHSLGEIRSWNNHDEAVVERIRSAFNSVIDLPIALATGIYASHAVAAAVTEALTENTDIRLVFNRMQVILKAMHDKNPSWGPLFIRFPGDISMHRMY